MPPAHCLFILQIGNYLPRYCNIQTIPDGNPMRSASHDPYWAHLPPLATVDYGFISDGMHHAKSILQFWLVDSRMSSLSKEDALLEDALREQVSEVISYPSQRQSRLIMPKGNLLENVLEEQATSQAISPWVFALCEWNLFRVVMEAFDLAFMFTNGGSKFAIALLNANQHEEAMLRVQELAAIIPMPRYCYCIVEASIVIEFSPAFYLGYWLKHAAIHGAQRYDAAIEAFETIPSKIDELCRQYVSHSEAEVAFYESLTLIWKMPHLVPSIPPPGTYVIKMHR
ncbi:hypothetical protein M405DRAFT_839212 [Rhizopogon salebrosus TDB-379]|nr:hypothetical protein M405DRAFT_839212 [Rhizopogon salebrosus TDB-379]